VYTYTYDLVTLENNNNFVKTYFNPKEKDIGMGISLDKLHEEYKTSTLQFQKNPEILVPYGSFKTFIEYNSENN